jgi:hypothetical protein
VDRPSRAGVHVITFCGREKKMHVTKYLGSALAAAMIFLGAGAVQAAPIPWAMPSGSTADYNFDNGNTDNQLFVPAGQSPTVTPTGLLFFPSGFKAQSANGTASIVSDTLRFQIHSKPGKQLKAFTVNEFGDYSIFGAGLNTGVKAFGSVFLTNLDTGDVRFDTLHTNPPTLSSTGVPTGQGSWTGTEGTPFVTIPNGWTNVQVVLNNELHANSDAGTSSVIEKKVVTPGIDIEIIVPEPGTISLMLVAGGLLISRRRAAVAV